MALWLGHQDARLLEVKLFVTSQLWVNVFGTTRDERIKWFSFDILNPFKYPHAHSALKELLCNNEFPALFLYSGAFPGLRSFQKVADSVISTPDVMALLHGSVRLQQLKVLTDFAWKRFLHRDVGGATNGQYWLGSSGTLRNTVSSWCRLQPSPRYCTSSLRDVLEFAPKGISVANTSYHPTSPVARKATVVPYLDVGIDQKCDNAFMNHGLAPVLSSLHQPFQVITSTPFTLSKWCQREITLTEFGLLLDLPTAHVHRLCSLSIGKFALKNGHDDIYSIIPTKIACQALWYTGLYRVLGASTKLPEFFEGGDTILKSFFEKKQRLFSPNWLSTAAFGSNPNNIDVKAVKHDDAEIPVFLWNDRCFDTGPSKWSLIPRHKFDKALNGFRVLGLKWWKRTLRKSLINYFRIRWWRFWYPFLKGKPIKFKASQINTLGDVREFDKDREAGCDCLFYASYATWWEWKKGSRLFFWRWSPEFSLQARDGMPMYWIPNKLATSRKPQSYIKDDSIREKVTAKVNKIIDRGYIKEGMVKSLIKYFQVPKGESDVRIVYDGTDSGFNDSIWVPNFSLPTIETLIRGTSPDTWMVDLDISDQFLNFILHEEARRFVGIDITHLLPAKTGKDEGKRTWFQWHRCAMGLKSSPYQAICATLFAEEFIKDFPFLRNNPFRYESVRVNLPGTAEYDPTQHWYQTLDYDGNLAAMLAIFVDDERIHHSTEEGAWKAARQVATRESYLGIQDAARKRRPPSQNAGAWAGSILRTNGEEVGKLVSQERWDKAKSIIGKWKDILHKDRFAKLNMVELRSDRGFLNYIARTYPTISTFLKGFHLTIDGWRKDRDDEGWKVSDYTFENAFGDQNYPGNYPKSVIGARRLLDDLEVLTKLTAFIEPPVLKVQSKTLALVQYNFGDASGSGFGGSKIITGQSTISILQGTWSSAMANKSSNFKELVNFSIQLKHALENGDLEGVEVFMFTDNSTAEAAFFNGTSKSKSLFKLVVDLKLLELSHSVKFHLIHVAGTRMIAQGTDGISRGMLLEGVLTGECMNSYIPIGSPAHERSPKLLEWIQLWSGLGDRLKPLTPEGWQWEGHGLNPNDVWTNTDDIKFPIRDHSRDIYLWCPAPAIASVALEELRKSRHKRPDLIHIFVCPKLMTPLWRKHLLRTCCFSFYVDPGLAHWPDSMHESLLIAVYLPYLPCYPWTFRRTESVLELERKLRTVPKVQGGAQGPVLREFLSFTRWVPTMHESLVRDLLSEGVIRPLSYQQTRGRRWAPNV